MARLRFPGRPGYRFDRIGVRYGADEASQTTDPTLAIVASIHHGLRHFKDLFGDSDEEEEFHGFSAKEISAAESKLHQAVREEQLLNEKRTEELKVRYERSQARLANYEAAGLLVPAQPLMSGAAVRRTYRKLVESDLVTDARSKLVNRTNFVSNALESASGHVESNRNGSSKSIKVKRLTDGLDSQGFVKRKRGRPRINIPPPDGPWELSPSAKGEPIASSNLFPAKPPSRYNSAAQHILAKAKHAAQSSSNKVRKFVLPTKSSRSSRLIKPNKRFLEEDSVQNLVACKQIKFGPMLSPPLPASSSSTFSLDVGDAAATNSFSAFSGQGLSLSPLIANREKGFPAFSTAPQPSGIASFTDGVASQKPLGLLDRPLIVEGKRPKKPSLIMRMKLVEDNPEDEILLQQQLSDVSPGKPISSYPNDVNPEEDDKSFEPSTSSPLLGKGFGLGKSLIAPAKLFTDTSKPSQPSSFLKHRKVARLSEVSSLNTVVLRQAKLQLNRTALNRSKAALARSLKAQLKREARLERRRKLSEKRKSLASNAIRTPTTTPSTLSQLSPFSQASVAADIDRQKSGLFEGMSDGIGSFSPHGIAATPDTTWTRGPSHQRKTEAEIKKEAEEECRRTLEELDHLRRQKYAVGGNYPCLVCGNMCRVKHNRKLPDRPLCRPCKKCYFFQINSEGAKRRDRICSKFGCCVILGQQNRGLAHYCIACKFQKFRAACSFSNTWKGESVLLSRYCSKSGITKVCGKKIRHKSGESKSETEAEQISIKKQRHQSDDSKLKVPSKRAKHRSGENKAGDFSDLKQTELSSMSKKELINAKNLDKPLSVDVSGDHLLGNLSPPQTQSSPVLSLSKAARSPTKKGSKSAGERDSDNSRNNDDDNQIRTSTRGPRIKHVCRRAAMVFPQQRATFPDALTAGRVLTLSALPNEEKEQLWARTKSESRKSMHSSEEESADEAKAMEVEKKPLSSPKREEAKERKATAKKTYKIEKLSSLKKRQKKEEKKRLWSEKRSQFRLQGGKRRIRCQKCEGCNTPDCGECIYCKDKTKFGGPNKIRKSCIKAICTSPRYSRKATHAFINPKSPKERGDEDDDNSGNFRPTNKSFINGLASRSTSARLSSKEPTNYQSLDGGSGNGASDSMEEADDLQVDVECSNGPEKPRNGLDMDGSQLRLKSNFSSTTNSRLGRPTKVPKMVEATVQLALTDVRFPNLSRIGDSFVGKLGHMKGKDKLSLAQRALADLPLVNSETAYLSEVPLKSHLIRADYREDYDVETAWYHGFSLTITGTSCVRTLCYLCGSAGKDEPYHSFCLEDDEKPEENCSEKEGDEAVIEDHQQQHDNSALTWCCRRCQFCNVCGLQNGLLKCDRCRDMYHPHCLGSNYPTKPSKKKNIWVCTKCVRCKSCGATTPGVGTSATWTYDFSLCYECGKLMDKGNFCPVCHKCYSDDDWESKMIHCAICDSWVHAKCEELTDEMYQLLSCLPDDIQFTCRVCSPEKTPYWEQLLKSEFVTGLLNVYNCLMGSKCTQSLMEAGPPRNRTIKSKSTDKPNSASFHAGGDVIISSTFPYQSSSTEACLSQEEESYLEDCGSQNELQASSSNSYYGEAESSCLKNCTENNESPDMEMDQITQRTAVSIPCSANCDSRESFPPSVESVVHRLCHCEVQSGQTCNPEILSSSKSVSCTTSLSVISSASHSNLSEQNGCETEISRTSDSVQECSCSFKRNSPSWKKDRCLRCVNGFDDRADKSLHISESAFESDSDAQNCTLLGLAQSKSCVNKEGDFCSAVSVSSTDSTSPEKTSCDTDLKSCVNCLQNASPVSSMQEQIHSGNTLGLQEKSTPEYANYNGFISHHSHMRPESSFSSSAVPHGQPMLTQDDAHLSNSHECLSTKKLQLEQCSSRLELKRISDVTSTCSNESLNTLVMEMEPKLSTARANGDALTLPNDSRLNKLAIHESSESQAGTSTEHVSGQQSLVFGDETREENGVATSSDSIQTASSSKAGANNVNHVTFKSPSPNLVMESSFDCARDFHEVRVKIQSGYYNCVEEFSEDMVRIIQYTLKENAAFFTRRKQANSMRSIFMKQMERNFPWFNVNTCKLWDHNRGFPEGMLKDAVLPPSCDHTYAQWMARQEIPMSPQPSPFKNIRSPLWPSSGDDLSPRETISENGVISVSPSTEDDARCCLLCGVYGDGLPQDSGRLLYCGQNEWIHIHCALWSAEVFEANDGSLQNVHDTVSRGKKLRCNLCQQAGATVGCCEANCPANYHFMCARQDKCVFQEDKRMFCKLHTHCVDGEVITDKRFETHRRVCVDIDRIRNKSWGKAVDPSFLSVLVGSCTVEKLGELKPSLSDTDDCLLPLGFTCTRMYWSTRDARRRCVYTCRIIEVKPETEASELHIKDIRVVHDEKHPDFVPYDQLNLDSYGIPNFTFQHNFKPMPFANEGPDLICLGSSNAHLGVPFHTSQVVSYARFVTQSQINVSTDGFISKGTLSDSWSHSKQNYPTKKPLDLSGLSASTLALLNIKDPTNYIPSKKQVSGQGGTHTKPYAEDNEELGLVQIAKRLNKAASGDSVLKGSPSTDKVSLPSGSRNQQNTQLHKVRRSQSLSSSPIIFQGTSGTSLTNPKIWTEPKKSSPRARSESPLGARKLYEIIPRCGYRSVSLSPPAMSATTSFNLKGRSVSVSPSGSLDTKINHLEEQSAAVKEYFNPSITVTPIIELSENEDDESVGMENACKSSSSDFLPSPPSDDCPPIITTLNHTPKSKASFEYKTIINVDQNASDLSPECIQSILENVPEALLEGEEIKVIVLTDTENMSEDDLITMASAALGETKSEEGEEEEGSGGDSSGKSGSEDNGVESTSAPPSSEDGGSQQENQSMPSTINMESRQTENRQRPDENIEDRSEIPPEKEQQDRSSENLGDNSSRTESYENITEEHATVDGNDSQPRESIEVNVASSQSHKYSRAFEKSDQGDDDNDNNEEKRRKERGGLDEKYLENESCSREENDDEDEVECLGEEEKTHKNNEATCQDREMKREDEFLVAQPSTHCTDLAERTKNEGSISDIIQAGQTTKQQKTKTEKRLELIPQSHNTVSETDISDNQSENLEVTATNRVVSTSHPDINSFKPIDNVIALSKDCQSGSTEVLQKILSKSLVDAPVKASEDDVFFSLDIEQPREKGSPTSLPQDTSDENGLGASIVDIIHEPAVDDESISGVDLEEESHLIELSGLDEESVIEMNFDSSRDDLNEDGEEACPVKISSHEVIPVSSNEMKELDANNIKPGGMQSKSQKFQSKQDSVKPCEVLNNAPGGIINASCLKDSLSSPETTKLSECFHKEPEHYRTKKALNCAGVPKDPYLKDSKTHLPFCCFEENNSSQKNSVNDTENLKKVPTKHKPVPETTDEESDYLVLEDLSFDDTHDEECNEREKDSQELSRERSFSHSPKTEQSAALVREQSEKGGNKEYGRSYPEEKLASGNQPLDGVQTYPQLCSEEHFKIALESKGRKEDNTNKTTSELKNQLNRSNHCVGKMTSDCLGKSNNKNLSQVLEVDTQQEQTQTPTFSPERKGSGSNMKKIVKEYPLRRRGHRLTGDIKLGSMSDSEALKVKPLPLNLNERSNLSDYESKAKKDKASPNCIQELKKRPTSSIKRCDLENKQIKLKADILSACPKDTMNDRQSEASEELREESNLDIIMEGDKFSKNQYTLPVGIQDESLVPINESSDQRTISTSHHVEGQIQQSMKSSPWTWQNQNKKGGIPGQSKLNDEVFQDSDGQGMCFGTVALPSKLSEKIKKESLARSSPGDNGPYKCPTCKRMYRTLDSYESHVQICDFEVSTSDEDEISMPQNNPILSKERPKRIIDDLSSGSNISNDLPAKPQTPLPSTSLDVHQPLSIIITDDFKDVKFSPLGQDLSDDGSSVHSQDSRRSLRKSTLTQRHVAPAHLGKVRVRDSKSTASPDSTCSSLLSPKINFGGKTEEKVSPKETMLEAVGLVSRRSLDIAVSPNASDVDISCADSVASRTRTMKLQPRISPTTMAVAPKREKKSPAQAPSASSKMSIMAGGMKKEENAKEKGVMITYPEVVEDVQMDAPKHNRRQRRQKRVWYVEESESSGDEAEAGKDETMLIEEDGNDERGVAGRTRHSRQRLSMESKPVDEKKSKLLDGGTKENDSGETYPGLTKCEIESPKSAETCGKKAIGKDFDKVKKSSITSELSSNSGRTKTRSSSRYQATRDEMSQDIFENNNAVKTEFKKNEKHDEGNKDEVDAAAIFTGQTVEEYKEKYVEPKDDQGEREGTLASQMSPLRRSRRPSNKTAKLNEYLANLKRDQGEDLQEDDEEVLQGDHKSGYESREQAPSAPQVKRGRGRPRIYPIKDTIKEMKEKKKRGRPKKEDKNEVDGAGVGEMKIETKDEREVVDARRDKEKETVAEKQKEISPKKQAMRVETRRSSLRLNQTNLEAKRDGNPKSTSVSEIAECIKGNNEENKNDSKEDKDRHISVLTIGDFETSQSKKASSPEALIGPGGAKEDSHGIGSCSNTVNTKAETSKTDVIDLTEDDDQKVIRPSSSVKITSPPDLQQVLPSHVTDAMRSSGQKLRIVVRSPNVEAAQKIGELLRKTAMNISPAAADISVTMTNIPEKSLDPILSASEDLASVKSANRDERDTKSHGDTTKTQYGKLASNGNVSDGSKTRHDSETPLVSRSESPDSISAAYDIQSDDFSSETSNDCYDVPAKRKDAQTPDISNYDAPAKRKDTQTPEMSNYDAPVKRKDTQTPDISNYYAPAKKKDTQTPDISNCDSPARRKESQTPDISISGNNKASSNDNTSTVVRELEEEADDDVIIGEVHGLQPPDPVLSRQPSILTTLSQVGKSPQPSFSQMPFVVSPPRPIIGLSPKRSPMSVPCTTTLSANTSPQSHALQTSPISASPFVVSEISPGRFFFQSGPSSNDFSKPKPELAQSKVLMQTPTAALLHNSSQPNMLFQTGAQPTVSIPNPPQPQPQTANLLLQHTSPPGVLLQQPVNQPTQPGMPVGTLLPPAAQPALSFLTLTNPRLISPQLSLQSLNPSAIGIPSILQQPALNANQPLLQSTVNANQALLQQPAVNASQPLVSILTPPTVYVPNLVQQQTQIQPPPPLSPQQSQLISTLGAVPFASPIGSQNPVNQTFNSSSLNLVSPPVTSALSSYHRVQSPIQAPLAAGKSTISTLLPSSFSASTLYQHTSQTSPSLQTSQSGRPLQQQQSASALHQLAATASLLQAAVKQASQPSQQLLSSIQQLAAGSASRMKTAANQPIQSEQKLRATLTPVSSSSSSPLCKAISSIQSHMSSSKPSETASKQLSDQGLRTKVNYMGSFELNSANLQSLMNPQTEEHERSRSILQLVKSALICPKGKTVPGVEVRPIMTQTPQGPKRVLRVFIDEDHLKNTIPTGDESSKTLVTKQSDHQPSVEKRPIHQALNQGILLPSSSRILTSESQPIINAGSKTSGDEKSFIQIPISQKGGHLFSNQRSRNAVQEGTQLRRPLKLVHSSQPMKRKFPASLYHKGLNTHDRGHEIKRPHVDQGDRIDGTIKGCYQQVVTRVLQPEVEQNPWQQVQSKDDKHNNLLSLLSSTSSSALSRTTHTTTSSSSPVSPTSTALMPVSQPFPLSSVVRASSSIETTQANQLPRPSGISLKSQIEGAPACQILELQPPPTPSPLSKPHPAHQPIPTQVSPHKRASFPAIAPVEKAVVGQEEDTCFSKKFMRKHVLKKMKAKDSSSKVAEKKKSQSGPRRLKTASLEGAHPLIHHKKSGTSLPQPCLEEEVVATPMDTDSGRDHPRDGTTRGQWPRNESQLKFEITSEDGFSCQGDTVQDAWNQVIEKVKDVRAAARMKQLSYAGICGRNMYGVDHDAVVYLIEQLYGAVHCHHNYKFRFHRYDLELADQEVPLNASGAARSEIFHNRKPYDMFNFLKSVYRVKPGDGEREMEEEMALKSARRATSLSLPMAMRFRKLKTFAKEAVDVYRSKIHGRGLFCKRNIDAGEMVIEYAGEVIRASLTDKREKYYESKGIGCYMFRIDEDEVVDATMHGSAARFINHSCEPNCFSKVIQVDGKKHIVIFAMRPIKRGEELTYDYKFPIEEVKIPCHCGSKRCRKYLN